MTWLDGDELSDRPAAQSVTLLPGASGTADFWAPMIAQLPVGWLTQAFDLPGLGSVPGQPGIGSYDDLVDYVARRLAAPTAVVAQSMGAYVGLQLTLRYPELVTLPLTILWRATAATNLFIQWIQALVERIIGGNPQSRCPCAVLATTHGHAGSVVRRIDRVDPRRPGC